MDLIARAREKSIPLSVHIDVTYRCDLACVHCYLDERDRRELTLAEYEALFDELRTCGTMFMLISGGDIFVRPDGLDIVEAAARRRFHVNLITHAGHITEEVADRLQAVAVRAVGVSLYSSDASVHDRVTQVPGSWEKTMAGVRRLIARRIPVTLKATLMTANPDAVRELETFARQERCHLEVNFDVRGGNSGSDELMDLSLPIDDRIAMAGCAYPTLVDAEVLPAFSPDAHTCMAGNSSCYVAPDGTVQPCLEYEESAGNIREQSFLEIWKTSKLLNRLRLIRRSSFSGCGTCENNSACSLCPARARRETGSPVGSAPSKCRETTALVLAHRELRRQREAERGAARDDAAE